MSQRAVSDCVPFESLISSILLLVSFIAVINIVMYQIVIEKKNIYMSVYFCYNFNQNFVSRTNYETNLWVSEHPR